MNTGDLKSAGDPESSEAGSLLVVDDNQVNCILLTRKLQAAGYRVTVSSHGRDALERIGRDPFDLVLLDVMMPEVSGLEVLTQVRTRFGVADLPVIMATAAGESADIVHALSLGANDYVTKPFDFPIVLARVRTQLQLRKAMAENRRLLDEVEVRNQFIRQIFGRYVDSGIVSTLLENQEALSIGGEKRRISVLMSDLRGFTTLAERLPPENVVSLINNYLTVMTDVIMDCGGTIDEFIGDAILVLFGAPVDRPDHERAAVTCAIRMQLAMAEVNRKNAEMGLPAVEMGIGVDSGEVVVGNIGSERRTKYGVVGRTVNLASRIESYTVGGETLISESTRAAAGEGLVIETSLEVQPKGARSPITIHRLRGIGELTVDERPDDLFVLPAPLPVTFAVLEGKDAGGAQSEGVLIALSSREASIRSESLPQPLADLKLHLPPDSPVYAKVTHVDAGSFRLHFTAISAESAARISAILRG